jgi:hypothetical protein
MEQRPSALVAFGSIGIAAAMWLVVGAPVAAGIAASFVSFWMLASFPEIAATASVLGAVQGLWFYLAGPGRSKSEYDGFLWLGAFSGSFLGVLGFPPVFSRVGIIAARSTVAVLLLGAIVGGIAAGLVSAHVLTLLLQGRTLKLGWRVVFVGLIIIAATDYLLYWPATTERIAVPEVSRQDITALSAGNARGSQWSGCYEFQGKTPLGQGGGSGLLKVVQNDGVLKVENGRESFLGGVDRSGRFRFGAEISERTDTLRILWQGKFHGNSFEFKKRLTVVNGVNSLGINPLTGTGQLVPCDQ